MNGALRTIGQKRRGSAERHPLQNAAVTAAFHSGRGVPGWSTHRSESRPFTASSTLTLLPRGIDGPSQKAFPPNTLLSASTRRHAKSR